MIPYSRQYIDSNDIKHVVKTLKSKLITQGPIIEKFEKLICKFVGAKYAVAVSSCSAGLHIAAMAGKLNKTKKLLTSPNSFCSTANAGIHCSAKVDFADINIETGNISLINLKQKMRKNKYKMLIPVHFAGLPVDMKHLKKITPKKTIIIEDAAHALGANYKDGSKIGCCKYSDMTVFSFHPVKSITTGEGGIVTTNNKGLYENLKILRSHGIVKNFAKKNKTNPWYYEMQTLGFHYRITDIQCALGISQLKKINGFIRRRRKIAEYYDKFFIKFKNCKPLQLHQRNLSANHLYVLKINFKKIKKSRKKVMEILKKKGISTQVHYIPIYSHPFYREKRKINLSNMSSYYEQCLSIPIFYSLNKKQQNYIIKSFKEIVEN